MRFPKPKRITEEMATAAVRRVFGEAPASTGKHHCHWPGCPAEVPPKLWGCRTHWYMLPQSLRDAIWREYKPGQEITKTPSTAYVKVAREVQEWIKENFGGSKCAPKRKGRKS